MYTYVYIHIYIYMYTHTYYVCIHIYIYNTPSGAWPAQSAAKLDFENSYPCLCQAKFYIQTSYCTHLVQSYLLQTLLAMGMGNGLGINVTAQKRGQPFDDPRVFAPKCFAGGQSAGMHGSPARVRTPAPYMYIYTCSYV